MNRSNAGSCLAYSVDAPPLSRKGMAREFSCELDIEAAKMAPDHMFLARLGTNFTSLLSIETRSISHTDHDHKIYPDALRHSGSYTVTT